MPWSEAPVSTPAAANGALSLAASSTVVCAEACAACSCSHSSAFRSACCMRRAPRLIVQDDEFGHAAPPVGTGVDASASANGPGTNSEAPIELPDERAITVAQHEQAAAPGEGRVNVCEPFLIGRLE